MDTNQQLEFALLCRLLGPRAVPVDHVLELKTSHEATRLCLAERLIRGMTYRQLAELAGLVYQHVGDYFNTDDAKHRRDLPGDKVEVVEAILGNTAITQYHLARSIAAVEFERLAA